MKKGKIRYISVIFLIVSIIMAIVLVANNRNKTIVSIGSDIEISNDNLLIDITRDDLNKKISDNENFFIYIGRPTCPDCKEFKPKLQEILKDVKKQMFYYNTEVPASQKQELREYLQTFKIESIPCILYIKDGKAIKLYDCQDTSQIQNFTYDFKGGN